MVVGMKGRAIGPTVIVMPLSPPKPLRRAGKPGGAERFQLPGAKRTGYFPIVFNPGLKLSASFGDSNGRANDAIFYLLGRAYHDPAFIWFQDRAPLTDVGRGGWPQEALTLLWRPSGEAWLPEAQRDFKPQLDSGYIFSSIGWGMIAPRQPDPPFFLAFKNGSLAANHTHLDLNHISIGYGDTMLAVELGSRPYPADYFSPQRNRSEEHTSELQSLAYLVCRLLLEKKNTHACTTNRC